MASDPPLLLAFDTSAAQCAAALLRGDRLLARRVEPMSRGQAERLLPMLEEVLAETGAGWKDLDGLAVCTGPGNFTGTRIAVAAARGLAMALDIPATGVSLFEALAAGRDGPVLVVADDRRGGWSAQLFRDGRAVAPPAAALPDPGALPGGTRCIGQRAEEAASLLGLAAAESRAVAQPETIGRAALARWGTPQPPPVPIYQRPADATPSREAAPLLLDDA